MKTNFRILYIGDTMKKGQKAWTFCPQKLPKPKVPEDIKLEVETKANELVESFLKPEYIKPPHEDMHFNYIVDIYTEKWFEIFQDLSIDECLETIRDFSPFHAMKERFLQWPSVKEASCQYST